ncbi:MAG: cell envelope integrity protein TolA [Candidatus Competibacteraceae bacterium]
MFKNLLIALLGIALIMMGLAYIQSERGRNYLVEQLRQATGQVGTTETAKPPLTTVPTPSTGQAPTGQGPDAPTAGNTTAMVEPPKPLDEAAIRAEVGKYAALFRSKVERSWSIPPGSTSGSICLLKIELQPDGKIQNVNVTQSSGDAAFDRSAVAAVRRAAPFSLPDNPDAAARFKSFTFKFNPRG